MTEIAYTLNRYNRVRFDGQLFWVETLSLVNRGSGLEFKKIFGYWDRTRAIHSMHMYAGLV